MCIRDRSGTGEEKEEKVLKNPPVDQAAEGISSVGDFPTPELDDAIQVALTSPEHASAPTVTPGEGSDKEAPKGKRKSRTRGMPSSAAASGKKKQK